MADRSQSHEEVRRPCKPPRHPTSIFSHTIADILQSNIALMLASDLETFSMTLRIEAGASVDKYVDPSEHCTLSDLDGQMLLCRMSSALAHLHALNMIHDDVKPDNIVWDPAGKRAVLIDFGAAVDYAIVPRDWFNPSGTPSYVPPEFIDRRKGPEGDIWGLGITMLFVWRLVQLPEHDWLLPGVWDEGGDVALRQWLAEVETLATGDHKHSAILRRMLEQDPDRRISSTELASASVDYMQRRNSS